MEEMKEKWMHKIRKLAPQIKEAEYEIALNDADCKRKYAKLKMKALGEGCKTVSAQEVYADMDNELYTQRLRLGECKGKLSALKVDSKVLKSDSSNGGRRW